MVSRPTVERGIFNNFKDLVDDKLVETLDVIIFS